MTFRTKLLQAILGVVIVTSIAIAIANLVVDLIQPWLDPRLREQR